ncbi:MAG TPA: 2-succinyl-5-enolpyruvyl-6-hydroxy-3-cyclohexene-1-carboxylic-acid synthase [Propionicimonas sp.]|uniref:2-succinyl-5-enolpyruvyl-6-hydroxy-3- cyclohexene-1-carboxylic-acid synthase n=1 Tax=Propionicimonas sp. TaxID=1955623 RepID=UPI002F3EBFCD
MTAALACAQAVIGQLLAQGVTDLVLAPGSRSAPLALVADAAARAGQLRLHVRVDERVAGFLALGLAKASGRCVPVLTTSGTAVGNLLPAAMEAHHSGVPLLVVSADRPAALVGAGANQTTDQTVVLAGFLRHLARLSSTAPAASWPAQVARAVLAAEGVLSRHPGPAQLNVELSEPLVAGDGPIAAPVTVPAVRTGSLGAPEPMVLPGTPPTVVICGDASAQTGRAAVRLAVAAGLPLVAEPTSNARHGAHALATGRLLLAGDLGARVQRAIVFGRPNLSRPVMALLSRPDVEVVVVTDSPAYVDPGWRASVVAGAVSLEPAPAGWLGAWQRADRARLADVSSVLDTAAGPTGPALARLVVAAVGEGEVLCLGNSNPIRDADLAPLAAGHVPVFGNRGLSGIDGTISTAIGVALATGDPTTLLLGDLAFFHDAGALAIGPGEPRPALRVVVADDGGGSIFATLEYGQPRFASAFERVFATPTGLDPAAVAAGYGVPARRVDTLAAAASVLAEPVAGLEVVVVSIDRSGRAEQARRIALGG